MINNSNNRNPGANLAAGIAALHMLWQEWLYSMGALTLVVILSFTVSKLWVPVLVLVLAWLLDTFVTRGRTAHLLRCIRIAGITARALVASAAIMAVCIAVSKSTWLNSMIGGAPANEDWPYISGLIIFPATLVLAIITIIKQYRNRDSHSCTTRMGYSEFDTSTGRLIHKESVYQLRLLAVVCLLLSVVNWIYYFVAYSNVSINGSDRYFYLVVPCIVFIMSLFYTGTRYHDLIGRLRQEAADRAQNAENLTELRFLILWEDELLLHTDAEKIPDLSIDWSDTGAPFTFDTPAVARIPYTDSVDDKDALQEFVRMSGYAGNAILKPIYRHVIVDGHRNVFHYAVILPDDSHFFSDTWKYRSDVWVTLDVVNRLLHNGFLAHPLAAEIHRIFTVTMAWKTYHRDGKRRYPIKNYYPTFRLRDFKDWDVDYEDPVWIDVATHNEDRPFYRLNRLLRRITRKAR